LHELPESSQNELDSLTVRLLNMILSHQTMTLTTERQLYEFIKTQPFRDSDYSCLVQLIRFADRPSEAIPDSITLISRSFEFLHFPSCSSFVHCDTLSNWCDQKGDRYLSVIQLFIPRDDYPFDGILSVLTGECGGNAHEKGIVEVSASAIYWVDCLWFQ
jgi:hypothetical protein